MRWGFFLLLYLFRVATAAELVAVTDYPTYNSGDTVRIRVSGAQNATAEIRYAGERRPIVAGIRISGEKYVALWVAPWDARTGRYQVDVTPAGGAVMGNAATFAIHRKLVQITTLELDKRFYTSGDPVTPRIVVKNLSNLPLDHLRVEFEAYTYPWIAPEPDEAPQWNTTVSDPLTLAAGEQREFRIEKAAVVQAPGHPVIITFAVVVRDARDRDKIYDVAYAPPAFTTPPNILEPKRYPFLYLYPEEGSVSKGDAYRTFYPPQFVSSVIRFDPSHTMFPAGVAIRIPFEMTGSGSASARLLDAGGKTVETDQLGAKREVSLKALPPGLYTLEVSALQQGIVTASNRLEIGVNNLPKSILMFCAHEDDDTAHPGIIRAAVENQIPIHAVFLTGGDSGGCDRFYSHTCDAASAMDFGEVRLGEARASLGHLGVPGKDISFLGLPDGGLGQIWYHHKSAADPYLAVLLASDHAPYRDSAIPNLPFALDSVLQATEDFITRYQPDLIITGHPDERHVDHRTNNWIVVKAMQELVRENKLSPETKLSVDVVYGAMGGRHAPYHFVKEHLYVSGECARMGQEATWYYQSQDGNHQQGEMIPYEKLPREEPYPHYLITDWQQHVGWNEKPPG